ncbi:MAG TPA: hypothetical protein VFN62_05115 [Acidobacteriaceae bacterium]|nr:hypothetical protein [Acidobacteriaceae bacterium]
MKIIHEDPCLRVSHGETECNRAPDLSPLQEQDFAAALLAVSGVADRAMVCRVQRCVREHAMEIVKRRRRLRHSIGLTILGFSLLLLVLTPVLWSSFHFQDGWQHFTDSSMQLMYLIGWLFPVTSIALVLGCLRMRSGGAPRRIDHHMDSRLDSVVR